MDDGFDGDANRCGRVSLILLPVEAHGAKVVAEGVEGRGVGWIGA